LISCNTCHNLAIGGVDGVEVAVGHKWTTNPHHLNSPTVFNAVFMDKQFWDGRAKDLEEQAKVQCKQSQRWQSAKRWLLIG